jgi:hypothetical protein
VARGQPTEQDHRAAVTIALSGLARGLELGEIGRRLEPLHPRNNTFPGEVLLDLAADAIDESGATRQAPLDGERLRERYLPESDARTKARYYKSDFAVRAAAMIRGGVDPALLDEAAWWEQDDLWWWSLEALVIYVRAAAERAGVPVPELCERIAHRHGINLDAD